MIQPSTTSVVPDHIRAAIHAGHVGQVTIFCDYCGVEVTGDYTGETKEIRFAAARRHLAANEGWRITTEDDLCPACGAREGQSVRPQAAVAEFHRTFGLPANDQPTTDIPSDLAALRVRLLAEEVVEHDDAVKRGDLDEIADALADIVYVVYGTALTYGIDLDAVIAEVHRSNMTKVPGPTGKAVKGAEYERPDIAGVLAAQVASEVPA